MPKQNKDDQKSTMTSEEVDQLIQERTEALTKQHQKNIEELEKKILTLELQRANQVQIKAEPTNGTASAPARQSVVNDTCTSADNKAIIDLTKPDLKGPDSIMKKLNLDRILRLRRNFISRIPSLKKKEKDDSVTDHVIQTNFLTWKKHILKLYALVNHDFTQWIVKVCGDIDLDEVSKNPDYNFPPVPSSLGLDTVDLIELTDATTSTISDDYSFLVNKCGALDVVKAYLSVYVYLHPNDTDTRSDSLRTFFTQTIPDDQSVSKFASNVQEMANDINSHQGQDMVNEKAIISTIRSALKQSARYPAYAAALTGSRDHSSLSQFLTHLRSNVDISKMPVKPAANMARTRGGRFGNRGRGGRGRGRGRNYNNYNDRHNNNKTTYLTGTNPQDGTQVVGKVIKDQKVRQPCFKMFSRGQCTRTDCPYNHNFNVIPTNPDSQEISNDEKSDRPGDSARDSATGHSAQVACTTDTRDSKFQDAFVEYDDEGEDDDFHGNFAALSQDVGYQHHANVTEHQPEWSSLLYNLFMFALLPCNFILLSLYVFAQLLLPQLRKQISIMCRELYGISNVIVWFFVSLFYSLGSRLSTTDHHRANAANDVSTARLPIVMDSGCTIAMSGDLSLFERHSMIPYKNKISLADADCSMESTHAGKILLNGQAVDALYVPSMNQTLLSMGWFLKHGFKIANDADGNLQLLLPNLVQYLSFCLSSNNLFYLSTDLHTHSS